MRPTPTRTDPALANWAFERPQITLGLRRMNSTRKRAIPLNIRYSPTIAPVPCRLPPRHQGTSRSAAPFRAHIAAWDERGRPAGSAQFHWESSCPTADLSQSRSSRRRKESSRFGQFRTRSLPPALPGPVFARRPILAHHPGKTSAEMPKTSPPNQANPAVSHKHAPPISRNSLGVSITCHSFAPTIPARTAMATIPPHRHPLRTA